MKTVMTDVRWFALPGLFTATWVAFATATLVKLAAMGGALTQLDEAQIEGEPLICAVAPEQVNR